MATTLRSKRAPFGELRSLRLEGEQGLVRRLICALDLRVAARRVDEQDSDRALVAASLVALDADLYVVEGDRRLLLGAGRCLDPLPLRQAEVAQAVELRLGVDLAQELAGALLARVGAGGLGLAVVLRGQLELWENPLYDEDGYQRMRVGDSGLSRALQAMGQVELAPLEAATVEVLVARLDWERALQGGGGAFSPAARPGSPRRSPPAGRGGPRGCGS
jgi:hypothetical protein